MDNNGPFGFDPDEFDRVVRETGEGLRDAFDRFGRFLNTTSDGGGFQMLFDQFVRPAPRRRPEPETAGQAGDGVWAIYISDSDGKAQVEQVYQTELDALRANRHNTDPNRGVRFLPYGIDVSVLDATPGQSGPGDTDEQAGAAEPS